MINFNKIKTIINVCQICRVFDILILVKLFEDESLNQIRSRNQVQRSDIFLEKSENFLQLSEEDQMKSTKNFKYFNERIRGIFPNLIDLKFGIESSRFSGTTKLLNICVS